MINSGMMIDVQNSLSVTQLPQPFSVRITLKPNAQIQRLNPMLTHAPSSAKPRPRGWKKKKKS